MKRTIIAGLIAIASFAALSQPAAAEVRGDRRAVIVRTADLDLENEAGAAVLEHRLRNAAARACHREVSRFELARRAAYRQCVHDTLVKATSKIDAPLVLARFEDIRAGRFATAFSGY
jgi:UrcA family protein